MYSTLERMPQRLLLGWNRYPDNWICVQGDLPDMCYPTSNLLSRYQEYLNRDMCPVALGFCPYKGKEVC